MICLPITTDRFTIRRFEPHDLEAYLQFMLDEDSTRFLALEPEQKSRMGATALFQFVLQRYDSGDPVHAYAIADNATGRYLGSCGFAPYDEGVVECYYCVNPEHRGQGIAVEATRTLVVALSLTVEVRAHCHCDNKAAHAVALRCKMKHVGHCRHQHSKLEGEEFVYPKS